MRKLFLLLFGACAVVFAVTASAYLPKFYYNEYGQLEFEGNEAQHNCFRKGVYYWDGNDCRKIVPVETCKAQGGEWERVQMVVRQYSKYICLCPQGQFWNGKDCVSNLPQEKKCRIEVWCDPKMSDIVVNVTPEIMDLAVCPR